MTSGRGSEDRRNRSSNSDRRRPSKAGKRASRGGLFGRWARRLALSYVLVLLTAVPLLGAGATYYVLKTYHLTPRQLALKVLERFEIDAPLLTSLVSPAAAYADHVLDGAIRSSRPRILLPELANWTGIGRSAFMLEREEAYRRDGINPLGPECPSGGPLQHATCWVVTGDAAAGRQAIQGLREFQLETPDVVGQYGNAWMLAFAYDLLANHPELTPAVRAVIETSIEKGLSDLLVVLDDPSPSLWHGRSVLAAQAWLAAIVLTPVGPERNKLITRAQAHFLDAMSALALTEAWPEGYNYWIQTRGLLLALAGAAYVNGLEGAVHAERIKNLLQRVGRWHVYATRPDDRIEPIGDEGSRLDLKDETRRVIDILAQTTRDPVIAGFSRYLGRLHGRESYYRDYRWSFRLFNDPTVAPWPGTETGSLAPLEWVLPTSDLFGRGAFNQGYIRTGWKPDDTFISFRMGHVFTHHGHYDAGHFTIFKGAPLAVNGSWSGPFMGEHRLNYSIRTVAKNSLLVLRPGERVAPNRFFERNVADGGQRIVLPTGSAIRSVAHWRRNLDEGLHLRAGDLRRSETVSGSHVYVSADITAAYNSYRYDETGGGGKVRTVVRSLLYLYGRDTLIVCDDLELTDPTFTPKWLLHTVEKPQVEMARVLQGSAENGILETSEPSALVQNGRGFLRIERVQPAHGVTRLVGGPGYKHYVEVDGDDSTLDGINFSAGTSEERWYDGASWRLEIQPVGAGTRHRFATVLLPSIGEPSAQRLAPIRIPEEDGTAVAIEDAVVVFARNTAAEIVLRLPAQQTTLFLVGLPGFADVEVDDGAGSRRARASGEGVLALSLQRNGSGAARLGW